MMETASIRADTAKYAVGMRPTAPNWKASMDELKTHSNALCAGLRKSRKRPSKITIANTKNTRESTESDGATAGCNAWEASLAGAGRQTNATATDSTNSKTATGERLVQVNPRSCPSA